MADQSAAEPVTERLLSAGIGARTRAARQAPLDWLLENDAVAPAIDIYVAAHQLASAQLCLQPTEAAEQPTMSRRKAMTVASVRLVLLSLAALLAGVVTDVVA